MVTSAQRMESTECWKYIQAKAQSGTKRVSRESPYCVKQSPNHPLVTFVERMLRAESGMFDIQPVLSAIPGPISTLVTLYFALNPPLCRLWEPAGALYTHNDHRSTAQICPQNFFFNFRKFQENLFNEEIYGFLHFCHRCHLWSKQLISSLKAPWSGLDEREN